ncbi:MAG TPA: N-acetylmuramoyl-L-alanine amidase [Clostridiales bacterium]|nr:N-acetylmuramoyl-L-alanine amidase [Clostridiales bacterium]
MRTYKIKCFKKTTLYRILGALVVVAFCAIVLIISKHNDYPENSPTPTQSPTPAPFACVILDAGHGGFDRGASGIETGIGEGELNLIVTKLVKAELEANNIEVILTRSDENALAGTKKEDMAIRKSIIQNENCDAVVSIHMNKFKDRSIKGPMVFYMKGCEDTGGILANYVIKALCEAIDHPLRRSNPGDYLIVRESYAPAVIIECGFLSNPEDERNLSDPEYQKKLAKGIARGIMDYLLDVKMQELRQD